MDSRQANGKRDRFLRKAVAALFWQPSCSLSCMARCLSDSSHARKSDERRHFRLCSVSGYRCCGDSGHLHDLYGCRPETDCCSGGSQGHGHTPAAGFTRESDRDLGRKQPDIPALAEPCRFQTIALLWAIVFLFECNSGHLADARQPMREGCSAWLFFLVLRRLRTELRRVRARSLAWSIFFQKPTK
jgi:hypothetical protein